MSKNRYILPFKGTYYVEYGGIKEKDSHSWNLINQRYAYDFEIRKNNLPYHDDYKVCSNFYCYNDELIAPLDGIVIDIQNLYNDTRVLENRPVINDCPDPRGNYILIKHNNNEYSLIAHILKDSFKVKIGDFVKTGDILAKVGNSGNTEGPHIHFQVQDGINFYTSKSIPISFKNIKINSKLNIFNRKYIHKGMYVTNKKL